MPTDTLKYPQNRWARFVLRGLGRLLLPLLTRTAITGMENFPPHGPVILIGNHTAAMEAVLMIIVAPRQVEVLGNGDIPFEPGWGASFPYINISLSGAAHQW
jgi:1-acyl-sn-glycerol-3-phosphate acyltransferase